MAREPSQISPAFPTTHWSEVQCAGAAGMPEARGRALGSLWDRYRPALKAHLVLTRKVAADEADDLLQQFVLDKFIEGTVLAQADQNRGRFRAFLVTVLDNYCRSHQRRQGTRRRRPQRSIVPFDEHCSPVCAPGNPARNFDIAWAKRVLKAALEQMQKECDRTGRPDIWAVFEERLLKPTLLQAPATPYGQLVERFNFASPKKAANVLTTGKRMYERSLRSVVGEYAGQDDQIDQEIAALCQVLSESGAE